MTPDPAEPRGWSTGRWAAAVILVFAVQTGLVLWLEDRSPVVPRKPAAAPVFRLADGRSAEWLALQDPTLFALPHLQGFAGEDWLKIPTLSFRPADWSEPARYLPLTVPQLGSLFRHFIETNPAPDFPTIVMREPRLTVPESAPDRALPAGSRLQIIGELAGRRLLSAPVLLAWTNTDLPDLREDFLTNSVVELCVDARGRPFSAALLPPGSGSTNVEQHALQLAKAMRFQPIKSSSPTATGDSSAGLTFGRLIFEWRTVLAPSTNSPAVSP